MKRWTTPPKWRLGRDPGEEKETLLLDWGEPGKYVEVPDEEAVESCVELLDGSPVDEGSVAKPHEYTDDFIRGQLWRRHPDYPGLYIVVELKGWSVARIGEHPRYIHDIQNTLAAAGFRLPFGWVTFPIYGASGGPTSRICFPVLDRVGSTRGSKDKEVP